LVLTSETFLTRLAGPVRWAPAVKLPSRDLWLTRPVPRCYREEEAEKAMISRVLVVTKGDYLVPAVPNINVTGQSEGSVRSEGEESLIG
jgi:hypothetical protein